MSKKFRRFYETAFDSKISKSDDDLLSADKQDAAIARRMSDQLRLSASVSSVRHRCDGGGDAAGACASSSRPPQPCKNRLFGFLLRRNRRRNSGGPQRFADCKYLSSDSVVTSGSSLSLESITSDSLSSHSSESPACYYGPHRYPALPHVLSPISDKSSLDAFAAVADAPPRDGDRDGYERRRSSATAAVAVAVAAGSSATVKSKPPQSLGLVKLNGDDRRHLHGSDSGISVGSKPGDSYQELPDVPFDVPELRRTDGQKPETPPAEPLPFDMPKLRRRQAADSGALPFDAPKFRKRQMDDCARVVASGLAADGGDATGDDDGTTGTAAWLEGLPSDRAALSKRLDGGAKKPDRSGLFLDVMPRGRRTVVANGEPSRKTFQHRNQPNRPTLSLSNIKPLNCVEDVDISLPLDQQCWYHGPVNRLEAEKVLHGQKEGSYLVRGSKGSYSLSIKSAKGFIHIRIIQSGEQNYLGQSDKPFDTIPDLIRHYTLNKLPVKGAEHVGLIKPLALQIL